MNEKDKDREDELGFGQIIALVLLLAPVINNADLWWDSWRKPSKGVWQQWVF